MSFKLLIIPYLLTAAASARADAPSWYQAPDVGWSWYKESPKHKPQAPQKKPLNASSASDQTRASPKDAYIYTKQMEKTKQELQEIQNKAVLYPTLDNVSQYMKVHDRHINRAETFENMWMQASLLSGKQFKEAEQTTPKARQIYEEKTARQLENDIRVLAKTHGLFFIYQKDCGYCHAFAPVVKELVNTYGFATKAISPDGQPLHEFPDAEKDNGTIARINPEGVFPSLFLINPHTGDCLPLARGLANMADIKANFRVIIQYLGEHHGQ